MPYPDEYRDEFGLPRKTEFKENGFGIDPDGCGCTDCIIGQSFNETETWRIEPVMRAGRTLYNRTGHAVQLPGGYWLEDDEAWRPTTPPRQHCPGCRCWEGSGY